MAAMEAAREGRERQLERLEFYLTSGEETVFSNHQGKEFAYTYDPTIFDLPRTTKIKIASDYALIDCATQGDDATGTVPL